MPCQAWSPLLVVGWGPCRPSGGEVALPSAIAVERLWVSSLISVRIITMDAESEAKIVLGPVIGQVTDTTARVIAEADEDCVATLLLKAETGDTLGDEIRVRAVLQKGVPGVFAVSGLLPEVSYHIQFEGVGADGRNGRLRTLPSVTTHLRVLTGACDKDKTKNRGPVNMWERIWEQHVAPDAPSPIDLFVHHGDQVYADPEFKVGRAWLDTAEAAGLSREERREHVAQVMAGAYRRTWNRPETARVLANVPNLCIWDDHEVRNDWGTFATDRDPANLDYLAGDGARLAYWRYQRQLWDDVPGTKITVQPEKCAAEEEGKADESETVERDADDTSGAEVSEGAALPANGGAGGESKDDVPETWERDENEINAEAFVRTFPGGKVALIMGDCRGARSFYYTETRPYQSTYQWDIIQRALRPGGEFEAVETLLVVHSSPLVFLGSQCSSCCSCLSKDKMGYGLHPGEQGEYLDILFDWRARAIPDSGTGAAKEDGASPSAAASRQRSLFLIGGDMHFSVRHRIQRGTEVVEQLTTSALSNKPPCCWQYYLFKCLMSCCCTASGGGGYSFSTSDWYPAQNFATLDLYATGNGHGRTPGIEAELVRSTDVCCDYRGCCYC